MGKIIDLSIAYWRLNKWVESAPIERKIAAENSLRTIKSYLDENNITVVDLTGQPYDPGLSVDIVYNENEDSSSENNLLVSEMMSPIIIQDGTVIQFGQVVVSNKTKESVAEITSETVEYDSQKAFNDDAPNNYSSKKTHFNFERYILSAIFATLIITSILFSILSFNLSVQTSKNVNANTSLLEQIKEINSNPVYISTSTEEVDSKNHIEWICYTIKGGDTLVSICDTHGIDYYAWKNIIIQQNGIKNENNIVIDSIILLPLIKN